MAELNIPVYNSTLKLVKQLEHLQQDRPKVNIPEYEIDRINEKVRYKVLWRILLTLYSYEFVLRHL
jgi:hypothetical protein